MNGFSTPVARRRSVRVGRARKGLILALAASSSPSTPRSRPGAVVDVNQPQAVSPGPADRWRPVRCAAAVARRRTCGQFHER